MERANSSASSFPVLLQRLIEQDAREDKGGRIYKKNKKYPIYQILKINEICQCKLVCILLGRYFKLKLIKSHIPLKYQAQIKFQEDLKS